MTAMRLRVSYDKMGRAFRISMGTLITLLWLLVCFCGAGEIAGPERVDEYRIAEFTASGDATSGYLWHVFPRRTCDIRTIDGGKRLLVTGPPGQYEIELVEIRLVDGAIVPSQTSHEFTIGEVVPPEPPNPPTPPDPEPVPDAPIPEPGLRVLIVFETENPDLTPQQQIILFGNEVRSYLRAKCTAEPQGAFRIWDKDIDTAGDLPLWQKAMERPRASVPWLIVSNGKTGYEGPLPADTRAFIELVKRYE